jgi:hypothetical protein
MTWTGHVECIRARRGAYRDLVEKTKRKRLLGRLRHRWEGNIKMALQEIWRGGMDWIDLAQDRDTWQALVNAIMNLQGPLSVWNFLSS